MWQRKTIVLSIVLLVGLSAGKESAAQGVNPDNLRERVLAAVNTARIANNLPPYAPNVLLIEAAQSHSDYQCESGEIVHTGPNGDVAFDRVTALGYPAVWVNENIYGGRAEPEEAVRWWLTADAAHRNNVLHESLREVGIGIGVGEDGTICYTMDISAQPGVLPVFINGGAETTNDSRVGLTLTTEAVFTDGQIIGTPVQVLVSNSPDFADPELLPWAAKVAWTLDVVEDDPGSKTVYVRYIDAAGRTVDASDSIFYAAGTTLTPTITPSVTVAMETITPTAATAEVETLTPAATVESEEAATSAPTLTETATAIPTSEPPTATVPPVQATALPTETPTLPPSMTPAPTMTPGLAATDTPSTGWFPPNIRIPTIPIETPRQQYFVAATGAGALALIILYLIIRSRG